MNRLLWLVCGIVLLMNPYALLAQRRGGHGAGTARAPVGASSTDDLKDFKRAVALQASPDQVVRFRRLTESKANSDVTKRSKTVTSDLERSRIARQQIYGVAERLDKALNDVQARQLAIGSKMGIQSEGSSQ
jgi:hypothetical protein